jgi:spermidine/putrescine transport system substrate-binding protein
MAPEEVTRRAFLRRAGVGAAGAAIGGPALLAACSRSASPAHEVRVFNEPLAIDDNTPNIFERVSGVFLRYHEFTDPARYLSGATSALRAHHDIGADVVVLPDAQAAQMIESGWAQPLPVGNGTRHRALPEFANPGFDPGRKFSLPWSSTVVGLAFDRRRVHDPVRSASALFDPKFAGKVALSADAGSTLGLVAFASGHKAGTVTAAQAEAAVTRVRGAVESGHVRSFATTEYIDDLVSGRALMAVGRADEIRDAIPVSPTLAFVVPTEGGLLLSSNMVVPIGAKNVEEAGTFIDYIFKPDPSSRFASFSNRVMAVSGAIDSLYSIDPKAARDPLVQPDPTVWSRLAIWPGTKETDAAVAQFAAIAASHRA